MTYAFFLLCFMLLFAYSRPFSMERLKAWIAGLPEPKVPRDPKRAAEELSLTP